MTSHKQLEQELKRPDSFQDYGVRALEYIVAHKGKLALMMAPLLVVVVVGYGIYGWQQNQSVHRRSELAKILTMESAEQTSVGKQNEAIQKEIDTLRAGTANTDKTKKPELSAETLLKISELEKKLADAKPDHSASSAAFKKFYDDHPKDPEGWMAGIAWASQQLKTGKISEVRPVIEDISKASSSHKFYQIQSRFMLASILEDLGEYDAALKEADVLSGLVENEAKPMALLLKGQLLYFKKDHSAAKTVLSELVEKHGSTREAQMARSLLAEIGAA